MIKLKLSVFIITLFFALPLFAQQNPSFQVYRTWNSARELLDNGKYVAAAEQFRLVESSGSNAAIEPKFESQLSLLKENAQYYIALCALEAKNDDAESLFLKFV